MSPLSDDELAAIDVREIPEWTGGPDLLFHVLADRRVLLAEVHRLREALATACEMREAFEGAAADLAQAGVAERDALRKVIAAQDRALRKST